MEAGWLPGRVRVVRRAAVVAVAGALIVTACGGPTPSVTPSGAATPRPSAPPGSVAPGSPSASPLPSPTPYVAVPLDAPGAVVLMENDGGLSLIDAASGALTGLDTGLAASTGFASWSPDGGRIASVQYDGTLSIVVFDVEAAVAAGGGTGVASPAPIEPSVLFQSQDIEPFYLSWSPDGETLSYLASVESGIVLRLVPTDGSAPLDGSGPGATVGAGSPLYYDWIDSDRLLAHVGTGPTALLGEIDLAGDIVGPTLGPPGTFRPAVISADHERIAFVRQDATGDLAVVVSDRDGENARSIPVSGASALAFHPTTDSLASIGPMDAESAALGFPFGPLRLMESGVDDARTLLDGSVVGFWWSPDGATIAALRVQPPDTPLPGETTEVHLLFVDVASGEVVYDSVVELGRTFVDQFIGYFDQYALSHQLWAPDSSAFLLPVADTEAQSRVAVTYPDGREPLLLGGVAAFWSP